MNSIQRDAGREGRQRLLKDLALKPEGGWP